MLPFILVPSDLKKVLWYRYHYRDNCHSFPFLSALHFHSDVHIHLQVNLATKS